MPEENWLNDYVFTVDEFLSPTECDKYIQISEEIGFEDALVTSPRGNVRVDGLRNNQRVMFRNDEIAESLWSLAQDFVPYEFEGRPAIGINEMLRFYRYEPGQQFDWHQDFPFERDNGEKSYLTFMVYLNEDCEGGETAFEDSYSEEEFDEFKVVPKKGMALFFEHEIHHKGEPVSRGRKYVLRTDVMYGHDDSEPESDADDDSRDDW